MLKPSDPRQLAIDLLGRSICSVQVAAVLVDKWGIFGWGWNSVGSGFGEHAEAAAIRRSSRDRLVGSTIYVASQRKRNSKTIMSAPCSACWQRIKKVHVDHVIYRDPSGRWIEL
jgi:pyrimidine deaminase RibD-like protein